MNPMILGSLISAGASLLGGNIQRNTERFVSSGDNARSHVDGIMDAASKHQINPLTLLGSVGAVGGQALGGSSMGAAIANAGLSIADGMAKKVDFDLQAEQLRMQRDQLQKKLDQATLRPKVAGVYQNASSVSSVVGADKTGVEPVSTDRFRPLSNRDFLDPRREVKNDPIKTHSGFMKVDNPHLPFPLVVPTLDGDEALQWYDYPSLAVPTLLGGAVAAGKYVGSRFGSGPVMSIDGQSYQMQKPRSFPSFKQSRGAALRDPTIPNHMVGR